jgi:EAL and modified HD-GYP domain-containing signal transduction protein
VKRLGTRARVMAKRVETEELYYTAEACGCQLFQGFYFCAPVMRQTKSLPVRQLAYLNLFAALNRPNLAIADLEDFVKRDVSLTYRVLRSVNSAAFGGGREITSVRQALVLLGINQIRKWASVWSLAGLNGGTSETMSLALIRARCCELMGTRLSGPEVGGEMFLLGLCSLLDVILSQPMEVAIADIQLSATVRGALLGEHNTGRAVLDAVIAYERADWDRATHVSKGVGLAESELPDAYADSLAWARELAQEAA